MSTEKKSNAFQGLTRREAIVEEPLGSSKFQKRPRVKDDRPRGIMIRLTPQQWIRVHELVLHENTNIQALGLYALSRIFTEKGLPEL
jgi:hypothetical protein